MARFFRVLVATLFSIAIFALAPWCLLAIVRAPVGGGATRAIAAALFGLVALAALAGLRVPRWRWRMLGALLAAELVFAAAWSQIRPSNDRRWRAEEAVLPFATFDGDLVTVHNIRNFVYRTETDFTPAYYDKTFDLNRLDSVDLVAVYWMGPDIAHIVLSFGFEGSDYLAISIEARKEQGEGYSTIDGFFRHYELFYVVADERDAIGVRAIYRKDPPEEVYLYPVRGTWEGAKRVFLDYLREINALRERPEFYNTLTTNCTSNIWMHSRVNPGHVPFSWKILISGHVPEYLYEQGLLDTRVPFDELRSRGHANERARAAGPSADFSQRIRVGLDGAAPGAPPEARRAH
jgi:Domain of unknown function (DUF4105)